MSECLCGRPVQDAANLCPECDGQLTANLYKIADRWPELEEALTWRESTPRERGGKVKRGMVAPGGTPNEAAMRARRAATDVVWFIAQVLREDFDALGWTFAPPRNNGTQDGTPALARWIASRHVKHVTHRMAQETAHEVWTDVRKAEARVFSATHPRGIHWTPVNLRCEQHTTDDQGSRVPCPGWMWAKVGNDTMPNLECDYEEGHEIEPKVWEREGWKRRHRQGLDPGAAARFAAALRTG